MEGTLTSGHIYEILEGEEYEGLKNRFDYYSKGVVRMKPSNYVLPKEFLKYAKLFHDFEIRPTDVFVNTFPKSGTNWVQEIVWNLVHNPNLDNPNYEESLDTRCPFLEVDLYFVKSSLSSLDPEGEVVKKFKEVCPGRDHRDGLFIFLAKSLPDRRLLKTHIPHTFLAPDLLEKAKVIYLARDPRDVLVSDYHFLKKHSLVNFSGSFEEFADHFMNGYIHGSYWDHVKLAWEKRNHPNFLFLHFEDLKENPKAGIKKIDKFIGTNRDDNQINNIVHCTSFSVLKEKSKNNTPTSLDNTFLKKSDEEGTANDSFFRKGQVGSWKEDLPLHLQEKVHVWMKENLKEFGDDFKYQVE